MVDLKAIKDVADWGAVRKEISSAVLSLVGSLPKSRNDVQLKFVDEFDEDGYTRYRVNYFAHDWERVSAWLFVPEENEEVPGVLCCHSATPEGKNEPAGISGDPSFAFAKRYVDMGYVTLAPDCITAGERVYSGVEPLNTKSFYKANPKASAVGRMLIDHMYALDAMQESKFVDADRIGVVGHALGGVNAVMLAAFDERVQAAVAANAFTRFSVDDNPERWFAANGMVLLPRVKKIVESGEFPFDWEHVLALAAPAAILLLSGTRDSSFNKPESCEDAVKRAKTVYKILGAAKAIDCHIHSDEHPMPPEALFAADDWFARWL